MRTLRYYHHSITLQYFNVISITVSKISLWNSKRLPRKLQQILGDTICRTL